MGAAGFPVEPSGLWREIRAPEIAHRDSPALFVDRDGTLIELVEFLAEPEGVRLVPGAAETLRRANLAGIPVIVVTNQSGIDRGFYDWAAFAAVQDRLHDLLAADGARIDGVYACPALAESETANRKPGPGMLHAAARDFVLDLPHSWIAGDSARDLEAGRRAGLAQGWLVPTGYGAQELAAAQALAGPRFHVTAGRDIAALGPVLINAVSAPK